MSKPHQNHMPTKLAPPNTMQKWAGQHIKCKWAWTCKRVNKTNTKRSTKKKNQYKTTWY